MKTLFVASTLALSLLFFGCGGGSSDSKPNIESSSSSSSATSSKSLIALYVAGSDLEENSKAASTDFNEIVAGYKRLSAAEQENLDILIAFGGARAAHWKGVKYADIGCLLQDSRDGVYGNDTCYSYENINANMGSSTTLEDFLVFASNDIEASARNFLIFWNHGGAYDGVCYDSNKNFDRLNISELDTALHVSPKKLDVIGMDACLMANIEVIKGIKDHSKYYLASENTEPGHGWDYEDAIYIIGHGNAQSLTNVGTQLVDSYIDSPKHQSTQDKTLSFLDLSHADDVIAKIDTLTKNLNGNDDFKSIGLSAYEATKFAVSNTKSDGITIDIKSFLDELSSQKSSIKTFSGALSNALDKFVVYSRSQSYGSNGVTIYQPLNDPDWTQYDALSYVASQNWHNLLSDFTVTKGADLEKPIIHTETECTYNNSDGFCLNITDNVALKSVESYGLLPYGDDFMLLYSENLIKTNGKYFLPKFNDNWFYICDGSDKNRCVFPSALEIEDNQPNSKLYIAIGAYNDEDATFFMQVKGSKISMWVIMETSERYSSKQQYQIKQGDKIRFDYMGVKASGDVFIIEGSSLTFNATPTWSKEDFNANIDYFATADDFNDNTAFSESHFTQGNTEIPVTNPIDTTSSQTRLSYLNGKTLTLNYFFGEDYNESVTFSQAPQYNDSENTYIIKGLRNGDTDFYCFSDDKESLHVNIDGVSYMYDCPTLFASGERDLFVFNINSDASLSGYYEYVSASDSDLNLYEEMQIPDTPLVASKIE